MTDTSLCSDELLTLLRADREPATILACIASLNATGGWPLLLRGAIAHGVAALVYQTLRPYHRQIPNDIWEALHLAYQVNGAASGLQVVEWTTILRDLQRLGIDSLILKGVSLIHPFYGNRGVRPIGDLDLLIRPEHLRAADDALRARGYQPILPEVGRGVQSTFESQVGLIRRDEPSGMGYMCELHWHLIDSPYYQRRVPMDWFWQTAVPLRYGDLTGSMLGREALVVHLCMHLALHHKSERLLLNCDIDRVLRCYGDQLDWQQILEKAQDYHLVLPLQTALTQTAAWLNTPVAPGVLERLTVSPVNRPEARAYAQMARPAQPTLMRFAADLSQMPDVTTTLHYLLVHLLPSAAYMRRRYGIRSRFLLPFAYLYRIASALFEAAREQAAREQLLAKPKR